MRKKMNSYGKTWHVWMTGSAGASGDSLPLGDPHLAWSFNRDGEAMPAMIASRDQRMSIDTGKKRNEREDLVHLAKPQSGVDDLKGRFPGAKPIPGVQDVSGSR